MLKNKNGYKQNALDARHWKTSKMWCTGQVPSAPDEWLHKPSITMIIDGLHPLWTPCLPQINWLTILNGLLRTIGYQLSYAQWYRNKTNKILQKPLFVYSVIYPFISVCYNYIHLRLFWRSVHNTNQNKTLPYIKKKTLKSRSIFSRVSCMGHWE